MFSKIVHVFEMTTMSQNSMNVSAWELANILMISWLWRLGLNIFYSSQDMIEDRAEQKDMFSPLHEYLHRSVQYNSK